MYEVQTCTVINLFKPKDSNNMHYRDVSRDFKIFEDFGRKLVVHVTGRATTTTHHEVSKVVGLLDEI